MAKKTINNKTAKRACKKKSYEKNVEDLELEMLRAENAKLKQCISVYQNWYEVPHSKLLHLIKLAETV